MMWFENFLEEMDDMGIVYKTVNDDKKIGISSYDQVLQFSYKGNYLGTEFMSFAGDAENSYERIFEEYSKVVSPQELDLTSLSQELFTRIYTLQEHLDILNEKEKLVAPVKNIDNYFVMENEILTKEELLQIVKESRIELI